MIVNNTNAKQQYEYSRYFVTEVTTDILKSMLFERAVVTSSRHKRLVTHGNKNGKGTTYYDICCGFDCETYTDPTTERAYMYVWQFSINHNVIIGRKYEELPEFLGRIKELLNPKENQRLLVFIHNMGYEFSFFRGWLTLSDAKQNFLKDRRTPLKLTHDNFIEFRDSMALTGNSLKGLAKDYCNTQKCAGDLDYSAPRNFKTVLTDVELSYCDNDVLILSEYAEWVFDNIIDHWHKLPLTRTGLLKLKAKQKIKEIYGDNDKIIHDSIIQRSAPDEEIYTMWVNWLYRGGYNHANVEIVGETIECDILGCDITSSYPYCMTQKIYPERFSEPENNVTEERVNNDINNGYVSIFIAKFTNIISTGLHDIESKSKCIKLSNDAIIDNGRVFKASEMVVYLTSFDWISYTRYYEWDSVQIVNYQYSNTRYLYKHIVCPMLESYKIKAIKKQNGEPYSVEKGEVNSYYGLNVQRLSEELTQYADCNFTTETKTSYDEQISRNIVCAIDGIFISACARFRLLDMCWNVHEMGCTGIYADTDSWKFYKPSKEVFNYINDFNVKCTANNVKNIEHFTEYNECYADLGTWDIEYLPWSMYTANSKDTYIKRFKSLGCKRYIIEVDTYDKVTKQRKRQLVQTVAGLPKGSMLEKYKTIDKCFEEFSDNMIIDDCKLLSKYTDEPYYITVTDYQGNTDTHLEMSCCALLPNKFSLSIDKLFKMFYTNYALTRLAEGVEYRLL